ncbi:hypothetical protein PHLCEN_2v10248 [Hermanssonia centrifuga]|uniref:Gag-pol polyprotein n=1 Tax=Hermanssonia centrifuga TaxID=98765 RepID=A0A2R6NNG3_9APHY|nr:hypothetical protein PHLCEN_2v10248 [Hermanssonia centrifuga]
MSTSTSTIPDFKAFSRLFDISSLENNGSNYSTWKFRVKTILKIRSLMPIVNGTEACPSPSKDDPKTKEITSWNTRDHKAKAQITLTLRDELLNGVMYAKTSKEVWDRLKDWYEGKGKQTIAYLITELFRGTLDDKSPLGP